LVILHSPVRDEKLLLEGWKVLEEIIMGQIDEFKDKIKHIGVSNYDINHLTLILKDCKVKPYVNQIEVSPFLTRTALTTFCKQNSIHIVAHSSLTKGQKFDNIILQEISKKYNKSIAQILLKWAVQKGYSVIPRTSQYDHLVENMSLDFIIDTNDMDQLDKLDENFATHPQYLNNL